MINRFFIFILFSYFSLAYAQNDISKLSNGYFLSLNHSSLNSIQTKKNLDLWDDLRKGFKLEELSDQSLVQKFEKDYSKKNNWVNAIANQGNPFIVHILDEVKRRNMPTEVVLLPFVESGFKVQALSYAGASGIWQFLAKTAKYYGLEQNHWYDGRNDVYAATDAALDYLQVLHNMFGDWSLAFAAYNCGEGRVASAVRRAQKNGLPLKFEYLDLPRETRNYVPRIMALRHLIESPQNYGIDLHVIKNDDYFEVVTIEHPIDIKSVAYLAGISEEKIRKLNPAHRTPVWIPDGRRKLLLPKESVSDFYANLAVAHPNDLLSWQLYRVEENQKLEDIAQLHNMPLSLLKSANAIKGNSVATGVTLLVKKQDSQEYDLDSLQSWNQMAPDVMPVILSSKFNGKIKNKSIKVMNGMTLSSIAKKFGLTVRQIKQMNKLKSNHIRIGQILRIR